MHQRRRWTRVIAFAALGALMIPAVALAAKKTCLTGTDPSVQADYSQIPAVRAAVDASCPCAGFDGSAGRTHKNYLTCVKGVVKAAAATGNLRKQCTSTVNKYYTNSICGLGAAQSFAPCIKTTSSGKITCAIIPPSLCVGTPGKFTKVACPGFTTCIDAADRDINGVIGAGDSGTCNPTGCCAFTSGFGGGLCVDTSFADWVGPATCQQLNGTWVADQNCNCDASTGSCDGTCGGLVPPTPTKGAAATPTQPLPPPPATFTKTTVPATATSPPAATPTSTPTRTSPPAPTATGPSQATNTPGVNPATPTGTPTATPLTPEAACVCTCGSNLMCTNHPISFNAIDCQNACANMGCTYTHYCSGTSTFPTECDFCLTIVPTPTPPPTSTPTPTATPGVPACAPQVCGSFSNCSSTGACSNQISGCYTTTEGTGQCGYGVSCPSSPNCTTSADCTGGAVCVINTCCFSGGFCLSPSAFCTVDGPGQAAARRNAGLVSDLPTSLGNP